MAEKANVELSKDQQVIFDYVETMVLAAVSAQCEGCSTARFEPSKIAGSVARGRAAMESAELVAARLRACQGLTEYCHYGSGPTE